MEGVKDVEILFQNKENKVLQLRTVKADDSFDKRYNSETS